MRSSGIPAIAAAAFLAAALPASATAVGRVSGSLRLREGERVLTPGEAERRIGGKRITLSLRNGGTVAAATMGADGRFTAQLAPGGWRLEWIDVGDRQEVLATPLALELREGATTCAGRIELAFSDLPSELGVSAAGTVQVEPGCDGAAAEPATATVADDSFEPPFGLPEVAEASRIEGFFADQQPGLRFAASLPLRRPVSWIGNAVILAAASRTFPRDGVTAAVRSFELGAGFTPYWGTELTGGVRWDRGGASGAAPWAGLRLGPPAYGFSVRAEFRDAVVWSLGLDVSAFHLLGRFL